MKRERNDDDDEQDFDDMEPMAKRPRKSHAVIKRETPRKSEAFKAVMTPDTPEGEKTDGTAALTVLLADINKKDAKLKRSESVLRDLEANLDELQEAYDELYAKHERLKKECTEVVQLQEALAKATNERDELAKHYLDLRGKLTDANRENASLKQSEHYQLRNVNIQQQKAIAELDAELSALKTRHHQETIRSQKQISWYKRLFYAALVALFAVAASWGWMSLKVDAPIELNTGTELKFKKHFNNKHFTLRTRPNTYTNITVLSNSNRMGLSVYNSRGWYASDNSAHNVLIDRYTVMDTLLVFTSTIEELSIYVHGGVFSSDFAIKVMPEEVHRLESTQQVHISKGYPFYVKTSVSNTSGIQKIQASCVTGTTFLYASAMEIPTVSKFDRAHTETAWVGKVTDRTVEIYDKKAGSDWTIMLRNDAENDSCRIEVK